MDDHHFRYLSFLDSQVDCCLVSDFSTFVHHICEQDYTSNFSTHDIFPTRGDVIKWVRGVAFDLGFVVIILRFDKYKGQPGRKTYVLLGCERGRKYRKYKSDAKPILSGTRKCDCPFRLRGKSISHEEGWMLNVICGYHNHDVSDTLIGHPYTSRLKSSKHSLLVDMTKSQVKPANIFLTLKENNECNVISITSQ